jgi:hypothetical protein
MNPAFAASARRLADLKREWERLESGNRLLDLVRHAQGVGDDQKSWVVNAALSSGVSGLYTGMEDILRGLLALVDSYVPGGERAHRDILDQASVAIDGVRPAIISADVYESLIALKGFRHFERHNYRFRFDEFLVEENEARAEKLVPEFCRDVERFMAAMSGDAAG